MTRVTRTLKNGGDTGTLDRAEVREVTAAIQAGRVADVLSGAVLQQFRAARNPKRVRNGGFADGIRVRHVDSRAVTPERSAQPARKTKRPSSAKSDRGAARGKK
jgi:anthranilate phosphoribosyltransferase